MEKRKRNTKSLSTLPSLAKTNKSRQVASLTGSSFNRGRNTSMSGYQKQQMKLRKLSEDLQETKKVITSSFRFA